MLIPHFAACVCLDLVSPRSAIHDWRMATSRILRDRLDHLKSINSASLIFHMATARERCNLIDASFPPRHEAGFIETVLTQLSSRRIVNLSSSAWTTLRRCTQSKSCRLPIDVFQETRKNRGYQSSLIQVGPKHGGSSRDWTEMHNNAATLFVDTPPPTEKAGG
jgi:hypothetical protein